MMKQVNVMNNHDSVSLHKRSMLICLIVGGVREMVTVKLVKNSSGTNIPAAG